MHHTQAPPHMHNDKPGALGYVSTLLQRITGGSSGTAEALQRLALAGYGQVRAGHMASTFMHN